MCDTLQSVNSAVQSQPSIQVVMTALEFLSLNATRLEPHVWLAVSGPWEAAVRRVFDAVRAGPTQSSWGEFSKAWAVVYASLKHTCQPHRWMVTQTPPGGPWGGRAISAPTYDTQNRVRRSYRSRGECDMALQLLSPQEPAVAVTSTVACGPMGCDERVSWAPKPSR
jgi:hypothetical protein